MSDQTVAFSEHSGQQIKLAVNCGELREGRRQPEEIPG